MKKLQKMNMVASALALSLAFATPAMAANVTTVVLPGQNATIDNLPTNQVYDQGVVFSAKLLDQWQTLGYIPSSWGDYQFAMGTGTIPVVVYSGAGNPVNGVNNPSPFQNGMPACSGANCSEFHGIWGLGSTTTQYAGTIGALQTMLSGAGMLLAFDHNEGGANGSDESTPNIRASGRLAVYDGLTLVKEFSFDNKADQKYVATDYVTACTKAVIGPGVADNFPCSIQAPSTHTYTLDANQGSGKPDFFIIFPEFDLYQYDPKYKIVIEMNMLDLDGGYEEMGIFGYRQSSNLVPEPGVLGLLGLGLVAMGGLRRRRS